MVSRSGSPDIQDVLMDLSGNRKRAHVEEGGEVEAQPNKRQHILSEDIDRYDDDISLDPDLDSLFNDADDADDAEPVDDEPEQGEILWSEDKEEYPPRAIYHADVKEHQARITDFAVNVTDQLSKVCHQGDDVAKLHAEAVACQKLPEPKKMVVALMGDAGSGMTSM
jgi:hypothetical protein